MRYSAFAEFVCVSVKGASRSIRGFNAPAAMWLLEMLLEMFDFQSCSFDFELQLKLNVRATAGHSRAVLPLAVTG